jgi:hypothetical protein
VHRSRDEATHLHPPIAAPAARDLRGARNRATDPPIQPEMFATPIPTAIARHVTTTTAILSDVLAATVPSLEERVRGERDDVLRPAQHSSEYILAVR